MLHIALEQPAGQRDICPVSVNLQLAFKKTFLFQASFPDIIIITPGKLFPTSSGS